MRTGISLSTILCFLYLGPLGGWGGGGRSKALDPQIRDRTLTRASLTNIHKARRKLPHIAELLQTPPLLVRRTRRGDLAQGVPYLPCWGGPGNNGNHPEPTRKYQQASGFLGVAKSLHRGCSIKARQAYIGENATYPPFWPFWAYSRTLPQGVELLV